ncbi:hypothetical protein A3H40_04470 [Candidatus Daviesbacteria bacterium RIFCSPLOWO2_02_FULL_38_15]|uniref:Carbohydrate kinase PfkB domain-containing protein n=1 Tax=Candidatus Daviesbacteria bacterium RIFCSPLOWO2_02_FULL_38_15 TaxID=1797794 RepID=A0A1F5N4D2_9BACT|nr:MAG: hypothetical protein A3H40_04470 [Candidatus Daviesbacteria bacterium RIFCSPLOWO2_02_FULL_38_15]
MYDLISIGDVVVDTYIPLIKAEVLEKDGVKLLGLPFGGKLWVEQSNSMVGGNAANNAVGSARLGLKTAIYTNAGNKDEDEWDDRIIAKLKKEKVDTRYVVETDQLPSNHNIVLDYKGERTILVHHQPWQFNLPDLDKTRWVYLTSMAPSFADSNLIEQIINYVEKFGVKLVYQPGTFQLKWGLKNNSKILVLSELFIVNLEEAKLFFGYHREYEIQIKKLLLKISDLGSKLAVITDGKNGSFGYNGEDFYKLEVFPANLVEMTGAGDAYASGLVAGLIYGKSLPEAMRWGAANGAAVVEQVGPQSGLLTYEKMQEKLKQNSKIVARQI